MDIVIKWQNKNLNIPDKQIDDICQEISSLVSKDMIGGIETIGDYGRKCAKEGFLRACHLQIKKIKP